MGKVSGSLRVKAARQYQHPAVHDVSVLCCERVAGDARKAFPAAGVHDQVRLGYTVVQHLTKMSDKLRNVEQVISAGGLFPSLWEGLGEGAKLRRTGLLPQPSPKGRGSRDFNNSVVGLRR